MIRVISIAACFIMSFIAVVMSADTETIREKELERIELNKKYDTMHLRKMDDFVTDTSRDFLVEPDEKATGEFTVAKTPPTVKMRIIPDMEPEYFTDLEDDDGAYMIAWANWARVTRSNDNRFYFSVSDHRGKGCHINVYEYSPARNLVDKVFEVGEIVGWTENSLTDGKIHGHMGIMPDGTLWAATHYGVHPDSTWWANGYRGSWLVSYNIYTHETKNWGVPLVGNMLPCFNVDTRRGRLVGTGANFTVLCWDCINKSVRFAGYPPNGWEWWRRAMLCDLETGKFWTSDGADEEHRLMSFDPEFNRFERYDVHMPDNPMKEGKRAQMRGYTDEPAADGCFYCATYNGAMFTFRPEAPDGPEIAPLGVTWDDGDDVLQMVVSPKGRYVYYYPRGYPAPLVQYDTQTGTRKALCWLHDYYFEKYGYWIGSSYGLEISEDGSYIVVCMNGAFQGRDVAYGHPSLYVIEIPESERRE